ncbi:MAG: hypothetical protein E7585_01265 [Ruminococcaceae bacterium]|nr:hypothetical protein [Oscillospiraceae bacterium]
MTKRMIALILCVATVLLCLVGCAKNEEDKGAYIRMYLTEPIYDVDPLQAFDNEATLQLVSLLFEGLFYADENGKPQKGLVDKYKYTEDKEEGDYILQLTLKDTKWSDGVPVTANDAQYAFLRLLAPNFTHPAVSMLYDIKNARAIAAGDDSVGHLGVTVVDNATLEIAFEHPIDVDEFLLVLCSPALYPLRDDIIDANPDWGKKSTTIFTTGPFMVRSMSYTEKDGFILERNSYYYRDRNKDDLDKRVRPYRIVVDYSTDLAEQFAMLGSSEAGALYYFGRIPLAVRQGGEFALDEVEVTDAASTHVYYLNENAEINGEKLFAKKEVRQALSLAIDRSAIAEAMVYAIAADGLVPCTLRNRPDKKATFRAKAESYIASTANINEAKTLLSTAGVTPGSYSFSITVASYDEDHIAMANLVKAAWSSLGFNVSLNILTPFEIIDYVDDDSNPDTPEVAKPSGIFSNPYKDAIDDLIYTTEDSEGTTEHVVEAIALDLIAYSPDAFSYLAPFAKAFSGNKYNHTDYNLQGHIIGYDSEAYNNKIEEAFAAEDFNARADRLHEAEAILMDEMPVIPIVYNQNATVKAKGISKLDSTFYCCSILTEVKLKNYWNIALRDEFVVIEEEEEEE